MAKSMEGLPNSCFEVQASLPLYVGADLEAPAMDAVDAHITGCSACAALHLRARTARSVLRELRRRQGRVANPDRPSLWDGIRAHLVEERLVGARPEFSSSVTEPAVSISRPRSWRRQWSTWSGVAAAAAAAVLVFWPVIERSWTPPAIDSGAGVADAQPVQDPGASATADLILPVSAPPWAQGIRPLQPAGVDKPSLYSRALSGGGPGDGRGAPLRSLPPGTELAGDNPLRPFRLR